MDSLIALTWPVRLLVVATFVFTSVAVFTALAFALQRRLAHRRIFAVPLPPGQHRRELNNALVFLALLSLAATSWLGAGWVDWSGAGWASGLATFFLCWFGFDVYYYLLHRAMHTRGLIRFHREHHLSHVTTPLSAFSTSVPECLGWLVGYALVPLVMTAVGLPVHATGFVVYMLYNFLGNVLGHVDCEVVPAFGRERRHSWTAHPILFHALHHARYTGHYSFCATFMDRTLGSEWSDWPELHARVLAGQPLTSLKQRGDSGR
ncbi:sterol desaturase family protein [Nannocystis radixulma]|uniref:Sterol desaturase family protein n=1 Tax=Nannocystis radixulma TaxID=2995305 RepID=A0ABT5AXD4_9BACT|nr:sterol desaturase family protein [Nannocystis radixulma]MDC0666510.1 sterol desaturase family protein [Nannocystis radixulma]